MAIRHEDSLTKRNKELVEMIASDPKDNEAIKEFSDFVDEMTGAENDSVRFFMIGQLIERVRQKQGALYCIAVLNRLRNTKSKLVVKAAEKSLDMILPNNRYPLRGKPLRYERPFDGVAESDWEAG
uniref:Uncharacterized protein n=1 Tax=Candidatus Kentrum sp. LFY TaxID=2126342 RepID=A0A450UUZ5_9GAMM|nr:MAG: hypothetical protein BECKLFY1418B_GA0070995_105712 [Candidatus Kentron sp. LFY]VFJ96342.1 MAG: hypothetical protein BECKLFY1418A_GA0070994_105813 [Candidatus Kentron sp. LFY]